MFSRALRTSRSALARQPVFAPSSSLVKNGLASRRSVTTDAASAHADKDAVPEVRFLQIGDLEIAMLNMPSGRRQAFPGPTLRRELRDL